MPIFNVDNPVHVTGTVSVDNQISGFTGYVTASIPDMVNVTGSVYVINQQAVTGHVTASITDTVQVTGSVYVINQQAVTGHVTASIDSLVSVTGSVRLTEPVYAYLTGSSVQNVSGTVHLSDNAFVRSEKIEGTLESILEQLQEMNYHLRIMTGEQYEDSDQLDE